MLPLGIPDEVADAKRCELFTFVPRSKSGNRSIAFILPNSFSDSQNVCIREGDCTPDLRQQEGRRQDNERHRQSEMAFQRAVMLFS